jgi:ferritin-like metal-binding protein YciE
MSSCVSVDEPARPLPEERGTNGAILRDMAHALLAAWLDDAYSMEQGLTSILQAHADDLDRALPGSASALREHISETQQHADRVKRCLQILNETPSQLKSTVSGLIGAVEGRATRAFRDELVKNTLMDLASEQFEIGCYRALIAAARQLGYPEIAQLCEQNLRDEERMVRWLEQQIPMLVGHTLTTTATRG